MNSSRKPALVLLAAAALAVVWAASRFGASYEALWTTSLRLGVGRMAIEGTLRFWIDDALMALFFFSVGREIRKELRDGHLADTQRALLPMVAALGGMIAPALIYLALNRATTTRSGFGVPMATDIAFAIAVLSLLGKRVPPALRVLLLALAIIDDIGAIVLIAVFYSGHVAIDGLLIAALGIALVLVMQRIGVHRPLLYLVPGVVLWLGVLRSGVHPAIAGVILGLLTPPRSEGGRLEVRLQWGVSFLVMPLFALANAGVPIVALAALPAAMPVVLGVGLGLVFGKPIGVVAACFVTTRLGLTTLPKGATWGGVLVVGCVAGVGFTMAIFIAGLAFARSITLDVAKASILGASLIAGILGVLLGAVVLPPRRLRTAEDHG